MHCDNDIIAVATSPSYVYGLNCSQAILRYEQRATVEPLYNGHIGTYENSP